MARRGHGEGSIYQRKDGRWTAAITLENRKRKTFYGKTRREVQDQLTKALHEQQQGKLATGSKQTVAQFLNQWIEGVEKLAVRLSTYARYRNLLDKQIIPRIGHIQLSRLTAQQVQVFYAQLQSDGLAPRTVHIVHTVLHKAMNQAVKWRIVAENVTNGVSLPRVKKHEVNALTKEQAQKLLAAAKGHELEAILTVALTTGMRQGEMLGLRWSDVDLEGMSLEVRRTSSRVRRVGFMENEPKTKSGTRKIILPKFVVDVLKLHRVRQLERRLQVADAWVSRDLVFCNATGDYWLDSSLTYAFKVLLKKAGLPAIRFHDLRHSAATLLLQMGVQPKVVQELLGHSQIGITMDIYSHVFPSMQQEAMNKLDEVYGQQSR